MFNFCLRHLQRFGNCLFFFGLVCALGELIRLNLLKAWAFWFVGIIVWMGCRKLSRDWLSFCQNCGRRFEKLYKFCPECKLRMTMVPVLTKTCCNGHCIRDLYDSIKKCPHCGGRFTRYFGKPLYDQVIVENTLTSSDEPEINICPNGHQFSDEWNLWDNQTYCPVCGELLTRKKEKY